MKFSSQLSSREIERFSRQAIINEFGPDDQKKLINSSILIVGMGGLGCPVSLYLTAAGVGRIGIVDFDTVAIHNLHRQILYTEEDIGKYKVDAAYDRLRKVSTDCKLNRYRRKIDADCSNIIQKYDLIVDCTDSIGAKYLLNDFSRFFKKKLICAALLRWEGQVYVFNEESACYRCLFPKVKQKVSSCDESGVLGPICGLIASMQSVEVIKALLNKEEPAMTIYDGLRNRHSKIKMRKRNADCTACNRQPVANINPISCKNMKYDKFVQWDEVISNINDYLIVDCRSEQLRNLIMLKNSIAIGDLGNIEKGIIVAILCSRGISAQTYAHKLAGEIENEVVVIEGGLSTLWKYDDDFPNFL